MFASVNIYKLDIRLHTLTCFPEMHLFFLERNFIIIHFTSKQMLSLALQSRAVQELEGDCDATSSSKLGRKFYTFFNGHCEFCPQI